MAREGEARRGEALERRILAGRERKRRFLEPMHSNIDLFQIIIDTQPAGPESWS